MFFFRDLLKLSRTKLILSVFKSSSGGGEVKYNQFNNEFYISSKMKIKGRILFHLLLLKIES